MRFSGLDIEITRGETASAVFVITDENGAPFRLLPEDSFLLLDVAFKVKADPLSKDQAAYIIEKHLDISSLKRFSEEAILNLQDDQPLYYNPLLWDDSHAGDADRLYWHQGLNEYRYYDAAISKWVPYSASIEVPFDPSDTKTLDYKEYFYDLILEAGNQSGISDSGDATIAVEYERPLVVQHRFVVSYRI